MYDVNLYIEVDIKGAQRQDGTWGGVAQCIDGNNQTRTVEDYGHIEYTTSNQLTLQALYVMLCKIKRGCNVTISVANQWVVNMLTGDRPYQKWMLNGWKTAKNKDVANKQDWINLANILEEYNIVFQYVPDHSYKNYLMYEMEKRKEQNRWEQES